MSYREKDQIKIEIFSCYLRSSGTRCDRGSNRTQWKFHGGRARHETALTTFRGCGGRAAAAGGFALPRMSTGMIMIWQSPVYDDPEQARAHWPAQFGREQNVTAHRRASLAPPIAVWRHRDRRVAIAVACGRSMPLMRRRINRRSGDFATPPSQATIRQRKLGQREIAASAHEIICPRERKQEVFRCVTDGGCWPEHSRHWRSRLPPQHNLVVRPGRRRGVNIVHHDRDPTILGAGRTGAGFGMAAAGCGATANGFGSNALRRHEPMRG